MKNRKQLEKNKTRELTMKKLKIKELDNEIKLVKINGSYRIPEHDHKPDKCWCFDYQPINE